MGLRYVVIRQGIHNQSAVYETGMPVNLFAQDTQRWGNECRDSPLAYHRLDGQAQAGVSSSYTATFSSAGTAQAWPLQPYEEPERAAKIQS